MTDLNKLSRNALSAAMRGGGKGEAVKAAVIKAVEGAIKAASHGSDAYVAALVAGDEIHALYTAPQADGGKGEVVYQVKYESGAWIDHDREEYEYFGRVGYETRILYAAPQAEQLPKEDEGQCAPRADGAATRDELMRVLTEYEGALQEDDEEVIAPARETLLTFLKSMLEHLDAAPQAECAPRVDGALREAVDITIKTLARQLDLIAERAPGNYLDKAPVVRFLKAHLARLMNATLEEPRAGAEKDATGCEQRIQPDWRRIARLHGET